MTLLRSLAFNIWFVGVTLVLGIAGIFARRLLSPRRVFAVARSWVVVSLGGFYRICGVRLAVEGMENLPPEGPMLIASQHRSAFDTLVWYTLVPRPAYVMKRELTRIPLVGPMLLATGNIPVDRSAGAAALRALMKETDRAVAEGQQIVIFPEGTRVAPGAEVALQPGVVALAARTGLPVIPVVTDSGRCWPRHGWRKRPGVIHIRVLPALPAGLRREELLERLRAAWQEGTTMLPQLVDNSVG